jgi:hypothetical protein
MFTELTYSAFAVDIRQGPNQEALLCRSNGDSAVIVERDRARVLDQCRPVRTLSAHAAHAAFALHLSPLSVRVIVHDLVVAGLLRPLQPPTPTPETSNVQGVDVIAIPTCDRPGSLARCLESYRTHCERWGRTTNLFVVDGSRTAVGTQATQACVSAMKKSGGCLTYVGHNVRNTFRCMAARAGFDADVVSWLLPDPPSCYAAGATRNLALIVTAGSRVLMADDDTRCAVRVRADEIRGIALVGHEDPRETAWFGSRNESTSAGAEANADLLNAHGAVLGRSVASLCAKDNSLDLTRSCKHLLSVLSGDKEGSVRISWSGLAGESAVYCPHGILFASGKTRERLAADPTFLRTALSSREVFRAVRQLTVTDEPSVMMYCAALDNAHLLPPFSPIGFNEDGQFGWLLRACDRNAFIAQLPYSVVHDSVRASQYSDGAIASASEVRTTEVLKWLCQPWLGTCVIAGTEARMTNLALFISALADMTLEDFRMHLRDVVLETKWRAAIRCESIQKEFGYPPFWQAYLQQYIDTLLSSVTKPGFYLPVEWQHRDLLDGLKGFQSYLRMYGRALRLWPELWKYCQSTSSRLSEHDAN